MMMTTQPFFLGMQQFYHEQQVVHEAEIYYVPHKSIKQSESIYIYGENESLNNQITHKILQMSFKNEGLSWIILHTSDQLLKLFQPLKEEIFVSATVTENVAYKKYHPPLHFLSITEIIALLHLTEDEGRYMDQFLSKTGASTRKKITLPLLLNELKNACNNDPSNILLHTIAERVHQYGAVFARKIFSEIGAMMVNIAKNNQPSFIHVFLPDQLSLLFVPAIIAEIKKTLDIINRHGSVLRFGIAIEDITALTALKANISAIHDLYFAWGRTYQITRLGIYRYNTEGKLSPLFDDPILPLVTDGKYQMIFFSHKNGLFDFVNRYQEGNNFLPFYADNVKIA